MCPDFEEFISLSKIIISTFRTTMQKELSKEEEFPQLTMENFNSVFRERFKEYALTCGSAGHIIITGKNEVMEKRERYDRPIIPVSDPDDPTIITYQEDLSRYIFEDNGRGDKKFERYEKKYNELMEGKKRLMYKLLSSADVTVKTALTTSPGYQQYFDSYDIHGMWMLTEQVCMGRGAISIYSIIVRLLQLKQQDTYYVYERDFKRTVQDLIAQGSPLEVLNKMINALFILGLDQEQFKEKLTQIYGNRNWPDLATLSAELHVFAEATQRMSNLKKDNNEGKIAAHAIKTEGGKRGAESGKPPRQCWNCGSFEHERWGCDKPMRTCGKCGQSGHMEKFCRWQPKKGEEGDKKAAEAANKKSDNPKKKGFAKGNGSKGNKVKARTRLLKKVLANIITADDDDEDNDSEEFDYPDVDDDVVADVVDVDEEA